ncbi:MAG: PLP-dependent aminotransferase family protein [Verrucomicrobia bacterium]|nr:PLP-dependent aminotransferase family protein [Verrucomicrobiota bacterium]
MKSSALSQLGRRTGPPAISWLIQLALTRPNLISLAAGFTDNPSLPVDDARAVLDEILASPRTGQPALQYGSTAGDPLLRELTAERLRHLDGAKRGAAAYAVERVVITHGSQQLLYILAEALCDPGDIVLVEDPTYFVFLGIAQSHGLRCRGIRLNEDGIDLEQLEHTLAALKRSGELRRVKLLYLVSYYQNPTGITTSLAKKVAALQILKRYERAAGHPIYLLEDAAYRELRFTGGDVPSALTAKGFSERVIYTGTYSKPFATGIRVGFGLLPEPLRTVVLNIKGNHDFGTAHLLQKLLARAIASGRYEKHLVELRARYAAKAAAMHVAMKKHFPAAVQWRRAEGGLYHWARLPARVKTGVKSKFFQAALARGVFYVPGALCYADDSSRSKPDGEMRLSFGSAGIPDLRTGIERLGTVLRRFIKE